MKLNLSIALFCIYFMPWQVLAEDITSRDFVEGYYLEVAGKAAVHSLLVPESLYRTIRHADLRDVRVFNGGGEQVPHYIRPVQSDPTSLKDQEDIPFFPLYRSDNPSDTGGISLQVRRDASGAVVNIQSDPFVALHEDKGVDQGQGTTESTESERPEISGYLLDLSRLKKGTTSLNFQWQKKSDSSVYNVEIQQSSDLIQWRSLVYSATLADLQFGGQRVEKRSVELPRQPLKYLKLTWQQSRWPLTVTGVSAVSEIIETKKQYNWVPLSATKLEEIDTQTTIRFSSDYRLPVTSLQVRFPGQNSMARLSLQSTSGEEKPWRTRCDQVFYNLTFEGSNLSNEPCKTSPTSDHLWRIVVKEDGAGLAKDAGSLSMELGWQPSELFFISRGTPPFLLAYGSGKLAGQEPQKSGGMLLQTIERDDSKKLIAKARLGKKIVLGGDAALLPPTKPPPWKKWLLWLVLVLGVVLMAYMARSLTKEMKTAEEKRVSEEE